MPKKHPHTSALLRSFIEKSDEKNPTLEDFVKTLSERGLAMALLICSLPNCLPFAGVTGISVAVTVPIAFFAVQMLLGRNHIWLPAFLGRKRFSRAKLERIIGRLIPAIEWIEKLMHPRLGAMCTGLAQRLLAVVFILLSVVIALPIPGGNFPPGVAMSFVLLALMERDGLMVSVGIGLMMASAAVLWLTSSMIF